MRKELGSGVRKGQWEAGDLAVPPMPTSRLMPAKGLRAGSAHLRALHPLVWEKKKKMLRGTKITYLKNAHKNPAVW